MWKLLLTGKDREGNERTAVCCLSSLNIEKYDEWKDDKISFVEDVMRFLDNVLQDFINKAPDSFQNAKYAAMRERSVGLGVMGLHSYFQDKKYSFWISHVRFGIKIFATIQQKVDQASKDLAEERGACPDVEDFGVKERFSNKTAIAPTASISIICGGASPGIEPIAANSYTHKTLSGSYNVRNKYLVKLLKNTKY